MLVLFHRTELDEFEEIVSNLKKKQLTEDHASVPSSAQDLIKYYNRVDLLPLACTKWVMNALPSMGTCN